MVYPDRLKPRPPFLSEWCLSLWGGVRANGRPSPGVSALCTDLIMIISDTCYGPFLISQYCCTVHDVTEITGRRGDADLLVITRRREPDVAASMRKSGRSAEFRRPRRKSPRCCGFDSPPRCCRERREHVLVCGRYTRTPLTVSIMIYGRRGGLRLHVKHSGKRLHSSL